MSLATATSDLVDHLVKRTDAGKEFALRLAVVHSVGQNGTLQVRIGDDPTPLPARHLGSYSPVVNDPVQLFVWGTDLLVIGSVKRGQAIPEYEDRDFIANPITTEEVVGDLIPRNFTSNPILNTELAFNAVRRDNILDRAVGTVKIAEAAINESLLAMNAVTETKIANDSITTPKITTNAIIAEHIQTRQILAHHVVAGTLTANEIAGQTITGDKISGNTIDASHIITQSIATDSAFITALRVTDANVDGTLSASKIIVGANTTYESGYNPNTALQQAQAANTAAATAYDEAIAAGATASEAETAAANAYAEAQAAKTTANTAISDAQAASTAANTAYDEAIAAGATADQAKIAADQAAADVTGTKNTVDGWRHATQTTLIDGGNIVTGTVFADKIGPGALGSVTVEVGTGTILAGTLSNGIRIQAAGLSMYHNGTALANRRVWIPAGGSPSFRGAITAESGTITGDLSVTGAGALSAANGRFRVTGEGVFLYDDPWGAADSGFKWISTQGVVRNEITGDATTGILYLASYGGLTQVTAGSLEVSNGYIRSYHNTLGNHFRAQRTSTSANADYTVSTTHAVMRYNGGQVLALNQTTGTITCSSLILQGTLNAQNVTVGNAPLMLDGAYAGRATTQSVSSSTWTNISWLSGNSNAPSPYLVSSTLGLRVPRAGRYMVSARAIYYLPAGTNRGIMRITVGGSADDSVHPRTDVQHGGSGWVITVAGIVEATAFQYINTQVWLGSAASIGGCRMEIEYLGPLS